MDGGDADYLTKSGDAARMGKAVEHLVAASCILGSRAKLNVSTALVDDEGVDLVFHRRGGTATMAVQVKARMSDSRAVSAGAFVAFIRTQTFRPRDDLYLLFVAVDVGGTFETAWLVPSRAFAERVRPNARGRLRFAASLKDDSHDRWVPYKLRRPQLPVRILETLSALEDERT